MQKLATPFYEKSRATKGAENVQASSGQSGFLRMMLTIASSFRVHSFSWRGSFTIRLAGQMKHARPQLLHHTMASSVQRLVRSSLLQDQLSKRSQRMQIHMGA